MKQPELKLYRGYASAQELVVSGHVFLSYPTREDLYERKGFKNIRSVFQLFSVKTVPNIKVRFESNEITAESKTMEDGYFRFTLPLEQPLESGWHTYQVTVTGEYAGHPIHLTRRAEFLVPYEGAYVIISDIDDTFLISYSRSFFRKLYVLLSKNVGARQSYSDVAKHYRLLTFAGKNSKNNYENTFFYVSSSEWNLYDYILRFTRQTGMPKAIIKLKKIKNSLSSFFMAVAVSHSHKQRKIEHIVEFYPHQKFILLGDDSQQDPVIYQNICKLFPRNIHSVFIRQLNHAPKPKTEETLANIRSMRVHTCYFKSSQTAIEYSKEINLITPEQISKFENQEKTVTAG